MRAIIFGAPAADSLPVFESITSTADSSRRTTWAIDHVVTANNDRIVLVHVAIIGTALSNINAIVNCDGQTMTRVTGASNTTNTSVESSWWYLTGVSAGTITIDGTFFGKPNADCIAAINYSNVNQVKPIGVVRKWQNLTTPTASVATTLFKNSLLVGSITGNDSTDTYTPVCAAVTEQLEKDIGTQGTTWIGQMPAASQGDYKFGVADAIVNDLTIVFELRGT